MPDPAISMIGVLKEYGPYGFGVVVFLVLWIVVVNPLIRAYRTDATATQKLADTLQETSKTQATIATSQSATSLALSQASQSLVTVSATLERILNKAEATLVSVGKGT